MRRLSFDLRDGLGRFGVSGRVWEGKSLVKDLFRRSLGSLLLLGAYGNYVGIG